MPRAESQPVYKDPDWLALARTNPTNWYSTARKSLNWVALNQDTLSSLVGHLGRCKEEEKVKISAKFYKKLNPAAREKYLI